jgi:hypothetical protein
MDLLEEIRNRSKALGGDPSHEGVRSVSHHIEVAERYLNRGRIEREDDLYNDVIYRTNQAFEGMLKEAYTVLTDKDGTTLTPHQIEQHFTSSSILRPRVMDLFTNYRKQWRNPSTHDHKLIFSEQEALLAIVSVSAFTNILIDQIVEKVNNRREQKEIESRKSQIEQSINEKEDSTFSETLVNLLAAFNMDLLSSNVDVLELSEIELIGRLTGFLQAVSPGLKLNRQATIGDTGLGPDLIIAAGRESAVVDVKRPGMKRFSIQPAINQMTNYLHAEGLSFGIIYVPAPAEQELKVFNFAIIQDGWQCSIKLLAPEVILIPVNVDSWVNRPLTEI